MERSPPLVTDGELDVVLREECTDVYKVENYRLKTKTKKDREEEMVTGSDQIGRSTRVS